MEDILVKIGLVKIFIFIYILGVILMYKLQRKYFHNDESYKDVLICFIISLTSWFGFLFLFTSMLATIIYDFYEKNINKKPPKWL
jgi:polyferredoxin